LGTGEQKVVDRNRGFKTATDGRLIICEEDNDEDERVKPGTKRKRQGEDSGKILGLLDNCANFHLPICICLMLISVEYILGKFFFFKLTFFRYQGC
jgi:hypothetical protein